MNIASGTAPIFLSQKPLAAITLIHGGEILFNQEALDAVRKRAKELGYIDRQRIDADKPSIWKSLDTEIETPSLFAPKRLLEIHFDGKKLDKFATESLSNIRASSLNNLRLLLHFPDIEKPQLTPWYKALVQHDFCAINNTPLSYERYVAEIKKRLRIHRIRLDAGAFSCLLDYHEGNLLGAQQAIMRLALYPDTDTVLSEVQLRDRLDDIARFSIIACRQALMQSKWMQCYRIAQKIEAEDSTQIIPLTWHISRDMSILLQLKLRQHSDYTSIFKTFRIYSQQKAMYLDALPKLSAAMIARLIAFAAKLDRINKGAEPGYAWLTFRQYCCRLAQMNHLRYHSATV